MKQEWLKKLPQFAQRFEMSLYQSAPSLEAYLDTTTLDARLKQSAIHLEKIDRQTKNKNKKVKAGNLEEETNNKDSSGKYVRFIC